MNNSRSSELTEAQKQYPSDRVRLKTRQQALFELLSDKEWHPNYECSARSGVSWHCSLYSIRKDGWEVQSRRVKGGVWEYKLLGEGARPNPEGALTGPQQRVAKELVLAVRKVYGETGVERIREHIAPWLAEGMAATR